MKNRVLLVEDDEKLRSIMQEEIEDLDLECDSAASLKQAINFYENNVYDLVVSDLKLPDGEGFDLLDRVQRNEAVKPDFILVTAFGTVPQAVEALKMGASDFLTKPLDLEHFSLKIKKVLQSRELKREVIELHERFFKKSFHGIIGQSPVMQELFKQIQTTAKAEGPVLIMGESGTGKELVARSIHDESSRKNQKFIPVNCASIPAELFESEFFGHEQGSFTGAQKKRKGLVQEAEGGTLFLDEISEMPLDLQAKLLRFLQEKKIRPVGGEEISIDVRILAATNRDLPRLAKEGAFREDLYYRLETFGLYIPSLRERGSDIVLLSMSFLQNFSSELGRPVKSISSEALKQLQSYDFPGNVRELKGIIERAVAFCEDEELKVSHLGEKFKSKKSQQLTSKNFSDTEKSESSLFTVDEILPLSDLEQKYISFVLDRVEGNKKRAASLLGIGRRTLYRRLEDLEK